VRETNRAAEQMEAAAAVASKAILDKDEGF
jgi:hypothetical protein